MTDNEIIKGLECCGKYKNCFGCPLKPIEGINTECAYTLLANALSLINRQKAEIERLKGKVNLLMKYDERMDINLHARLTEKAKAEAIKEFAERLKEYIGDDLYFEIETNAFLVLIDKLIYEMVGDSK